ncbi:MAG: LacI family DNA-binding transcriptional regulator [Chloroflexi bacterium]|nr:LacI family DNA-binding transcriptional regulator [Chloroflexota bacterium]
MPVTVKDVARAAGVAPTTVSNVFTGHAPVREEVRRRVLDTAERLGYRRNPLAIGLRTGRSPVVGLLFEDLSRPVAGMIQALQHRLEQAGYASFVVDTEEDPGREERYLDALSHYRLAGLVSQSAGGDARHYLRLVEGGTSVVLLERTIHGLETDLVDWDHAQAASDATAHLARLGHRRIGLLVGDRALAPRRQAVEGWQRALRAFGIEPDPALVRSGRHGTEMGERLTSELLESTPQLTGLVISNRSHTMGAVAALNERGVRMPDDLAVVGMATDSIARLTTPPLTYVRIPEPAIAETLGEFLLERLSGASTQPPRTVVLRAELIVGGSCDAHLVAAPASRPAGQTGRPGQPGRPGLQPQSEAP